MSAMSNALTRMIGSMVATIRRDEGQTMAEYGLILAGIAVVVMVTALLLGTAISDAYQDIIDQL